MRLSYLIMAPVLALSASAQIIDRNFAINGCVGLDAVLNPALGLAATALAGVYTTEAGCANQGFSNAYFLGVPAIGATVTCACSNVAPRLDQYIAATAAVNGATTAGVCGTVGFENIALNTRFALRACATANAFTSTSNGPTSTQGSVASCLASCTTYAYAIFNSDNGLCSCATGTSITNAAALAPCASGGADNQIYFNGAFPATSRTARKRDFDAARQKTLGLCPTGLQACVVDGLAASAGQDAFECIDTRSELESCGGCLNGSADTLAGLSPLGVDCSSLPGVALGGSTCTFGKCEIFACKKGHALVKGKCARI